MVPDELVAKLTADRALTPGRPVLRGTAQNPDTFFQAREACNAVLRCLPRHRAGGDGPVRHAHRPPLPASSTTSAHPDAERVIVIMGSGADVDPRGRRVGHAKQGEKVGVLKVRLFRPFVRQALRRAPCPDREEARRPGPHQGARRPGDPLYQDVVTALREGREEGHTKLDPMVIGGRYGLSSKEFTPAMVKAVFDELAKAKPKNHFTVGIMDDVTTAPCPSTPSFDIEPERREAGPVLRPGRGRHGRRQQELHQDHRRGDRQLRPGLLRLRLEEVRRDHHLPPALRPPADPARLPDHARPTSSPATSPASSRSTTCSSHAAQGATFLLNTPHSAETGLGHPAPGSPGSHHREEAQVLRDRRLRGGQEHRHGRAHQHHHADLLLRHLRRAAQEEAIAQIKKAIKKTYGKKGDEVVQQNFAAVDETLAHLHEVKVPATVTSTRVRAARRCPTRPRTSSSGSPP